MRICIAYASFFPYHLDRIYAVSELLRKKSSYDRLYALQLCDSTRSYNWPQSDIRNDLKSATLIKSTSEEELNPLHVFYSALKYLKVHKISVLFVPSYWPSYNVALLCAAKTLNIKVVLMTDSHLNSMSPNIALRFVKKILINCFDAAFVAGQPQLSFLKSIGFSNKPVSIGFDCIDNNNYISTIPASSADFFGILSVCRMLPKKNIPLLIQAFSLLCQHVNKSKLSNKPRPKLLLVGNGPEINPIIRCVEEEGLSYAFFPLAHGFNSFSQISNTASLDVDIIFYDYRDPDFVRLIYKCSHVFVLPSLSEEWGLVVNEAMSSALPVILSSQVGCSIDLAPSVNNSSPPTLLSCGYTIASNGFVFQSNSLSALSLCLQNMFNDYSGNYRTYAQYAQSSLDVIRSFSLESHAENLLKLAFSFRP